MSKTKEKYIKLCDSEKTIPIFSQYWWLDSLCQNGYWDVIIIEKNDEIVATLPFYIKKKYLFKIQTMPALTQNLGLWIKYPKEINSTKRTGYEVEIIKNIIAKLPNVDLVNINMHYALTNYLPFHWNGFVECTRYTYIVEGLENLDEVFNRFNPKMQNKVRKAEKLVTTVYSEDIEAFYKIIKKTFDRQGIKMPYSYQILSHHDKALKERQARKIFFAIDEEEKVHSALYLTWDKMSSYVHMVGEDPKLRASGAGIKLIWDAIQFTKNELKLDKLDFEGSMIESVERVRRNCGGVQYPYSNLTKTDNAVLRGIQAIRNITRR